MPLIFLVRIDEFKKEIASQTLLSMKGKKNG